MTNTYSLEELALLPRPRLLEIRAAIDALVGAGVSPAKAAPELTRQQTYAWEALRRILGEMGYSLAPYAWRSVKDPAAALQALCVYVEESFGARTGPAQYVAAAELCIRIIVAHLTRCSVPVTPKSVLGQCANLPGLVERELPGYRSSGLLPSLLERRYAPHTEQP